MPSPRRDGSSSRSPPLIGHWMVPPAMDGDGEPAASPGVIAQLDGLAYGGARRGAQGRTRPGSPRVPALWNIEMIGHMAAADSQKVVAIDPAVVMVRGRPRATWLAVRVAPNGRTSVAAVADDRTGQRRPATVLFGERHHAGPGPRRPPRARLGAFRPDAPPYRFESGDRRGVEGGGGGAPGHARVGAPGGATAERPAAGVEGGLAAVAGGAARGTGPVRPLGEPVPRIVNRALVWVTHGYVAPRAFPSALGCSGASARSAPFTPASSRRSRPPPATRIYPGPSANAAAAAWAAIAQGVVEPASAIPRCPAGALSGRVVPGAGPVSSRSGNPSSAASEGRPAPAARSSRRRTGLEPGLDGTDPHGVLTSGG